jgi:hypothetical protein
MEITGKIIQVLEAQSGASARGEWKRQDFIIETQEQYPKKVCLSNWNNKVDLDAMGVGTTVTAGINIESREYNGRWYTDVRVWKMDIGAVAPGAGDVPPAPTNIPPAPTEAPAADDLPF